MQTSNCPECDSTVTYVWHGQDIRATRYEPAEYAYVEIIGRECDTECTISDIEMAWEMTDAARN